MYSISRTLIHLHGLACPVCLPALQAPLPLHHNNTTYIQYIRTYTMMKNSTVDAHRRTSPTHQTQVPLVITFAAFETTGSLLLFTLRLSLFLFLLLTHNATQVGGAGNFIVSRERPFVNQTAALGLHPNVRSSRCPIQNQKDRPSLDFLSCCPAQWPYLLLSVRNMTCSRRRLGKATGCTKSQIDPYQTQSSI
ncbi:hypothetical protein BJ166DRAFT_178671 [Pestalotiopsis sp. NC0098]|nr:hypothetical protein BJ166DRAFT_178671 [Pestalotiopsis sp. NC0098]